MAHVEGNLGLVTNGKAKPGVFDQAEWQAMLTYIAEDRGYKPGCRPQTKRNLAPNAPVLADRALARSPSWVRGR
jgi:hypothetical protein